MYTYTDFMGTKTISIMDDVYERLSVLKGESESFSMLLRKLSEKKVSILEFAGAWGDSVSDAKKINVSIEKMRKGTRLRELYGGK